jgi:hypothetical protein
MSPGTILFLLIIIWICWRIYRWANPPSSKSGKADKQSVSAPRITVTVTSSSANSEGTDLGELTVSSKGEWILNPKSAFPLTVYGIDEAVARNVKSVCDQKRFEGEWSLTMALIPLVARSNLRCKEVDGYIGKFKLTYSNKLEELKRSSAEWTEASERDRKDLLGDFRRIAVQSLDIQPNCDLVALFECEPQDSTIDDALIDRFGYETLQLYFRYAKDLAKVYQVPSEYRSQREGFDKLAQHGLAMRGTDIPFPAILETLKLKDMRDIVADLDPPKWTRKAQAIEYLLDVSDIKQRAGKLVAYRELFQLKPLPPEFVGIELESLSSSWRYTEAVASLISRTYIVEACAPGIYIVTASMVPRLKVGNGITMERRAHFVSERRLNLVLRNSDP